MPFHRSLSLEVLALAALACGCPARRAPSTHAPAPVPAHPIGSVSHVTSVAPTPGPHRDARSGDLVLHGTGSTALILAAVTDVPGHPPIRGAVVDVEAGAPPGAADPVSWWRFGWIDGAGAPHVGPARSVTPTRCPGNAAGTIVSADLDGVTLDTTACAAPNGAFVITTRSRRPLPAGASLADEISVNATPVAVDRVGIHWSPPARTNFIALSESGTALSIEAPGVTLVQGGSGADDPTRTMILARWPGATAVRTAHLGTGDTLDAMSAMASATHSVTLHGPAGSFTVRNPMGDTLVTGRMPATGVRAIRLPSEFGASIEFRDARGVPARHAVPLGNARVVAPPIEGGTMHLAFHTEAGTGLPVHVVLHGLDGTPDPTPEALDRAFAGGRSVYLLDGTGDVGVAAGKYRVTASHGPRFSLSVHEVTVATDTTVEVADTMREVVHTPGMISADFHLHASPSPDSRVPLDERVASLVCEGVDFAVATDHNHVTDYGPIITSLGVGHAIASIPGDEVTTYTPFWGHFIVWPLAPTRPREGGIISFFETTPARIFADARARGAQVVQVNHPRFRPVMGYFDHVAFDPATGHANPTFATDFDAIEVFNGWSIEHPDDVRRVLQDLVGLARRGMHPTATGNSDSHQLLYEEAGWPRTYVTVADGPQATLAGRVAAGVKAGRTTISAGPLVTMTSGTAVPGDTIRPGANGRVRVHVHVEAPAWVPVDTVEVWLNDRVAVQQPCGPAADGVRFDGDVDLTVTADAVVLALATSATPLPDVLPYAHAIPLGFTGTMRVDFDGDGRVVVPARGH